MKKTILFLLSLTLTDLSIAQEVSNVMASQNDEKAIIKYDIANSSSSTNYFVKLFYSTDGGSSFSQELRYVAGDVGANVSGGTSKSITWDAMKEVNALVGNVVFKVEAITAARMPDPVTSEDFTFKIISCKRIGNQVKIGFELINNGNDKSTHFNNNPYSEPVKVSYVMDNYGGTYRIKDAKVSGSDLFKTKQYVRGIINPGYILIQDVALNIERIGKVFLMGYGSRGVDIAVKNIPIQ